MLFADGHLHTNPIKGLGAKTIAKKFKDVNGWFMVLVGLSPKNLGFEMNFDGYVKSIEVLLKECEVVRKEGLKVACLSGIHPADIDDLVVRNPRNGEKILDLALNILNYIGKLIKSGLIDGIGEIGRPHYKTIPESFIANSIILKHALDLARDLNCFVHLHLEQGGYLTVLDIENTVKEHKINKYKIVFHHSDILTSEEALKKGFIFTIPGKYQILKEAFRRFPPDYIVESDFIDDPKRPGVSSYPWQIVENQLKLLNENVIDENYLWKLNVDNIAKFYNVSPP
ncbi:MAG: TatD family hydrolase [Ignisphaera sp.]